MAFFAFPGNGVVTPIWKPTVIVNSCNGNYVSYQQPIPMAPPIPMVGVRHAVIGPPIDMCVGQVTICSRCGNSFHGRISTCPICGHSRW